MTLEKDDLETSTTPLPPTTTPKPSVEEIRLHDGITPSAYRLDIISDHENNVFNGTISIDITVNDTSGPVTELRIHCKDLNIIDYQLVDTDNNAAAVTIKSLTIDTRLELCIFNLAQNYNKALNSGSYTLTIQYGGLFVPGQIIGFYKSNYTTIDGELRFLTATKFEPTYARMAFPCFDEPGFKATWDISVTHPSEMIALSNEGELYTTSTARPPSSSVSNSWSKTTFKRTPKMATYLVAFIVSDFKYTETRTTFGTRVRVYSRPDQVAKTEYATETAATVLRYFEDYTGIQYPLSKLGK